MKVLFVCLGNICRSPIAHGILERYITELNLPWIVDSAATSDYHTDHPPHIDSQLVCHANGINIENQKARQISAKDFREFDKIFAMDSSVYEDIINKHSVDPYRHKILLITDLIPDFIPKDIPDPYFGGKKDFQYVYQLLDELCGRIIEIYHKKKFN